MRLLLWPDLNLPVNAENWHTIRQHRASGAAAISSLRFSRIALLHHDDHGLGLLLGDQVVHDVVHPSLHDPAPLVLATAMRGRAWEVVIHPFSFEEYLQHHQLSVPEKPDFLAPPERSALERAFQDYLMGGSFPEAQNVDIATHHGMLRDYVDVALLRDVMERHGISNVTALRWLVRHLLGNAAG
jgi:hypothetical protein